MTWIIWAISGLVVLMVYVQVLALCVAAKRADSAIIVPERTAAMCEYGLCRERWTALVDLGLKGHRYVCDAHVQAVVSETVDPTFAACGVAEQ